MKELDKVVDFEDLVKPLVDVVKQIYKLKQVKKEAKYEGYNLTKPISHINLQPDEILSKKGLEEELERGREPIEVIISIAVQLGICQGYRIYKEEHGEMDKVVKETYKLIKS